MHYKGMKFSDRLIEKAAYLYSGSVVGRSYIYKRDMTMPDGSIKVDIYQRFAWTRCTPHVCTVAYAPND